jgi:hypothetical protein
MPSYVVTGVSRGLGVSFTCPLPSRSKSVFYYQYEFLRQRSSDPENTVIGLVRDKPATDKKLSEELNIPDYDTLKMSNYPLVVH